MNSDGLSEIIGLVTAILSFLVVVPSLFTGIRSRNPAKRKYWESELRDRLGSGQEWPSDSELKKRAELAIAYLDADEAIRRVGVPGPAASWVIGAFLYLTAVSLSVYVQGRIDGGEAVLNPDTQHPNPVFYYFAGAILLAFCGVASLWDAILTPGRRRQLQRVLVQVILLEGGGDAVRSKPETLVNCWENEGGKRIKKSTKKIYDQGMRYELWAQMLLSECFCTSKKVRVIFNFQEGSNKRAIQRLFGGKFSAIGRLLRGFSRGGDTQSVKSDQVGRAPRFGKHGAIPESWSSSRSQSRDFP